MCLVLIGATLLARGAEALDPTRTLTQYVHRIWQTQQGLPQASIYALIQTADGRLWLGTQTGLVQFDGVRFTTVDEETGVAMPSVWVTALVEDQQHALWVGTDASGVFRVFQGAVTRYTSDNGLPSDSITCLFMDRAGRVWACTTDGLAIWNGVRFDRFTEPSVHALHNVSAACEDADRRIWVAHDRDRLDTWSPPHFVEQPVAISKSGAIRAIMCGRSGAVWVGTTEGLIEVAGDHQRRLTASDGLADTSVFTVTESQTGDILVGTTNGFSRVRGNEVDSFRSQDGLSQSAVYALYEDREGTLWVATGHGLNQFLDGRAMPYTTSEGLPTNNTGPIVQDSRGTIWVGTLGAGLARFENHRFATLTTHNGLASNTIVALAAEAPGRLWVGTDRGLNHITDGRVDRTLTTTDGLPSDAIVALWVDTAGTLWIGTARGAASYHGRVERVAAGSPPIVAFGGDQMGRVYLAPKGAALQVYERGHVSTVDDSQPALRNVDAIYTDHDGVVWLGTAGDGLLALDHGRIARYSVRDGLFDNSIYAILGDGFGRLWMACSKGIFSVDRAQLRRFATGQLHRLVSTPYSPTDVLRTIECKPGVQPAASTTADGLLWFSTTRGLLVLDSHNADRHFEPPPAALEEITVNGARIPGGRVGALPPGQNNVAFRYTGLSLVVPARITFKYKLEGFDAGWVDAGTRREAFYTNLPPGRFQFRVAACNLENECREAPNATAFSVEPRYYQRAWFIPLCLVGAVVAGLVGFRLHTRRLQGQFALILAERSRIARELHDTLIQGFSGITMAMQALAAKLPGGDDRQTLEQIVADAGTSLREARLSLSGLRRRPESASDFADAIAQTTRQLTDAKGIRLKLNVGDWTGSLSPDVEYNLLRIAQEAVLNAVKHSGTRTLLVALEQTATRVRLLVQDNGSGFAGDREPEAGHFGLLGMRERAAHIGAELRLNSAPGHGTAVLVSMDNK